MTRSVDRDHRHRGERRRRGHGDRAPRAAAGRRPVPPGVDPHPRRRHRAFPTPSPPSNATLWCDTARSGSPWTGSRSVTAVPGRSERWGCRGSGLGGGLLPHEPQHRVDERDRGEVRFGRERQDGFSVPDIAETGVHDTLANLRFGQILSQHPRDFVAPPLSEQAASCGIAPGEAGHVGVRQVVASGAQPTAPPPAAATPDTVMRLRSTRGDRRR